MSKRTIGDNRLAVLADEVRAAHSAVMMHMRQTVESAMDAGDRLIEAKELLPHGRWLPWLRGCGISARTAQRYMRLAANREHLKSDTVAHLGVREAIDYLADIDVMTRLTRLLQSIHPGIKLHPVGLELPKGLTFEQWQAVGHLLLPLSGNRPRQQR